MEFWKKKRTPLRAAFTKKAKELDDELNKEEVNQTTVEVLMKTLKMKYDKVEEADEEIMSVLQEDDAQQDVINAEVESTGNYSDQFILMSTKVKSYFEKVNKPDEDEFLSVTSASTSSPKSKKKFKLPKIEWQKFGGEPKDWLGFWSQFAKIDDDEEMDDADKFQYLLQAVEKGSRAEELVASFPPSAKCYPKAIESLKDRFGNEDILVEVYVRELLRLVLQNVLNSKTKIVLSSLYDKLETQLRALETLGVTSDKYAAMLYPLVESCLPEDTLRVWERSRNRNQESSSTEKKNQLTLLMDFLCNEVKGEERISMARRGFDLEKEKTKKVKVTVQDATIPTAVGLLSGKTGNSEIKECVFCDMKNHFSKDCRKAKNKMSMEERKSILVKKGACFSCLQTGHLSNSCVNRPKCTICSKGHYPILCFESASQKEKKPEKKTEEVVPDTKVLASQTCSTDVLLQTLLVRMSNGQKEKVVRAVMDGGAMRSYITKEIAHEMGYHSKGEVEVKHSLFGGVTTSTETHNKYGIVISSLNKKYKCTFDTLDKPRICNDISKIENGPWIQEATKLGVVLTDVGTGDSKIQLLIGADVLGKLYTGNLHLLPSGPVAIETHLGWTLMGKIPKELRPSDSTFHVMSMFVTDADVSNLWKLDTIGITDAAESKSREELQQAAIAHFKKTVTREPDGRFRDFEISLPWIEGHPPLGTNRKLAEKRLVTTTKKLQAGGNTERYEAVFQNWLDEDIIEKVPETEIEHFGHYLPHRAVFNENSRTTPVRPVFDAGAKEKYSPSLNDCLEKGPNLLELIPAVLTRFRLHRIGVVSDITKAFLQIGVREVDRNFLRFLWWEEAGTKLCALRHRRVVFGVNSSPFLLGAVLNHHLDQAPEEFKTSAEKLRSSLYVDNCVASVHNKQQLEKFMEESVRIMAEAKFTLTGWIWNSENRDTEVVPVLGLKWELKDDYLSCDLREVSMGIELPVTKRKILSAAHRIFDPVGFSSPVTLCPKLLLQEIWEHKLGWDEEVPTEIAERFKKWKVQLPDLEEVKIPRWIFGVECTKENWSLHTFVDASKLAYAACVFLRGESENKISLQLVLAKTRVAPVKKVTIPRLELLACTIGARLANTVKKILNEPNINSRYWTDSSNALSWIRREEQWGTFVWNRVKEIRELSKIESWNHVPGNLNPADLPSRGCNAKQLLQSSWWEGPEWLRKDEDSWPKSISSPDEDIVQSEKIKSIVSSNLAVNVETFSERLMKNTQDYRRILRIVACYHKYKGQCKKKKAVRLGENFDENQLSFSNILQQAEMSLVKLVQSEDFKQNDTRLMRLQATLGEDGVIRVQTKLCRFRLLWNFSARSLRIMAVSLSARTPERKHATQPTI